MLGEMSLTLILSIPTATQKNSQCLGKQIPLKCLMTKIKKYINALHLQNLFAWKMTKKVQIPVANIELKAEKSGGICLML